MARGRDTQRDEVRTIVEVVSAFHEHGLHLPTRAIYVGSISVDDSGESGVDARMAERFIKNMHALEALSSDGITITMDNVGGDVYHGLAMFDAITTSPCDVKIVVRGKAASMGSIILQAADERVMGPLSTMMIHYGEAGYVGHAKTFPQWAKESKRIDRWMEQMYLARIRQKRPGYPLGALKKLLSFDTFLTAQQSIDLGLADAIG